MILPGKLCIGILEEDNPLKSYYRFKPLLVREGENFLPFTEHEKYPEDGCIRIVPDKNESGRFKQRMRQAGLFAMVDLTGHPVENDKIRANKNYRGDGVEHNAYIIYSDVVQAIPAAAVYQMVSVEDEAELSALRLTMPHAERVLVTVGGELQPVWFSCAIPPEDAPESSPLVRTEEAFGAYQTFETPGFGGEALKFALAADKLTVSAEPVPAAQPAQEAPKAAEPAPVRAAAPSETPEKETSVSEKPWISRNPQLVPSAPDEHLSPIQQILAQQSGLNPRKGKSLVELIDEKWQHSRMAQLGQSVEVVTGAPVVSPIDRAVEAVRAVWDNPAEQKPLLEALSGIEEFGLTLTELRQALSARKINEELDNLEAQKIAIERDLQYLRENRAEMRKQMKTSIRREDAAELADIEKAVETARGELKSWQSKVEEARRQAKSAQDALDALSNGKLEERLRDFAVNSHIMDLLEHIKTEKDEVSFDEVNEEVDISFEEIDLEAFIDRVFSLAQAKGYALTREQAANLCVCFAVSPVTILSGAPGTGKTAMAKLLSEALCWNTEYDVEFDWPQMKLCDDCNAFEDPDPMDGWMGEGTESRACLTVRDSGEPLSADILDKGFMIRLELPDEDTAWGFGGADTVEDFEPASLEAIRTLVPADDAVTPAQKERMAALRKWLAGFGVRLSYRALNETCRYCALMNAYADEKRVFDLAVAQRILPGLLASAPAALLKGIQEQIKDMPVCAALLRSSPPIRIL